MKIKSSSRQRLLCLSLSIAAAAVCPEQAAASSWFVAPQASTLGLGAQVGYRSDYDFSVRAAWNQFDFDKQFKIDRIKYDTNIRLKSMGLLFDFYPLDNGFHLTAGLYRNDNQISGTGMLEGNIPVRIGNRTVRIDGKQVGAFQTKIKYAPVAPYLGIGYHNVTEKGFSFTADVGVLYQGHARVSVEPPAQLSHRNHPLVKQGIDEQKREIEKRANKVRVYPVITLGVAYTF